MVLACEIKLDEIREIENPVSVELEFINTTPWWGGKHVPNTVVCLDPDCHQVYVAKPSASSVKGILRWLFRIAVADYISDEELNEPEDGDQGGYIACEAFLRSRENTPSLLELLFGTIRTGTAMQGMVSIDVIAKLVKDVEHCLYVKPRHLEQLTEYFLSRFEQALTEELEGSRNRSSSRRRSASRPIDIVRRVLRKILEELEVHGYKLLRGEDDPSTIEKDLSSLDWIALLMTIPRYRLLCQGCITKACEAIQLDQLQKVEELLGKDNAELRYTLVREFTKCLFELQPIRPGCVKTIVRIGLDKTKLSQTLIRLGYADNSEIRNAVARLSNHIEKVLELLTIVSLELFGVGKATSRGFGKFACLSKKIDPVEALEELSSAIKNLIEEYAKVVGHGRSESVSVTVEHSNVCSVPRLSVVINKLRMVENPKHPCLIAQRELTRPPRNSSISVDTLPVLGKLSREQLDEVAKEVKLIAILSAVGKMCLKSTWKLLLNQRVRDPGYHLHTWLLGLPRADTSNKTGYYVADANLARNIDLLEKLLHDKIVGMPVDDDKLRKLTMIIPKIDVSDNELKRWRSPFIFTPLVEDNEIKLLIVPILCKDIEPLVIGVRKVLVHVGKHGRQSLVLPVRLGLRLPQVCRVSIDGIVLKVGFEAPCIGTISESMSIEQALDFILDSMERCLRSTTSCSGR